MEAAHAGSPHCWRPTHEIGNEADWRQGMGCDAANSWRVSSCDARPFLFELGHDAFLQVGAWSVVDQLSMATSMTASAKSCGASCGRLCPMPPVMVRCAYLPENFFA